MDALFPVLPDADVTFLVGCLMTGALFGGVMHWIDFLISEIPRR